MDRHEVVYQHLTEVACAEKTISYNDLAAVIGLDVDRDEDRAELIQILHDIAYRENAAGHPLLTAVVVRPEIRYPGQGFFLLAREMGYNHFDDERSYYWYELKRVYAFWRDHEPAFDPNPYMIAYGYKVLVGRD